MSSEFDYVPKVGAGDVYNYAYGLHFVLYLDCRCVATFAPHRFFRTWHELDQRPGTGPRSFFFTHFGSVFVLELDHFLDIVALVSVLDWSSNCWQIVIPSDFELNTFAVIVPNKYSIE